MSQIITISTIQLTSQPLSLTSQAKYLRDIPWNLPATTVYQNDKNCN